MILFISTIGLTIYILTKKDDLKNLKLIKPLLIIPCILNLIAIASTIFVHSYSPIIKLTMMVFPAMSSIASLIILIIAINRFRNDFNDYAFFALGAISSILSDCLLYISYYGLPGW